MTDTVQKFLMPILVTAVLGAGALQAQVFWHSKAIANNGTTIEKHIEYDTKDHDAITRIEKDVEALNANLKRLEKKIDANQQAILEAIKENGR